MVRSHTRAETQHGVRYATDFRLRSATTTHAPLWPVPWPAALIVDRAAVTMTLHSTALPDDVMVKSWRSLIPDGHRVPDPLLATPRFECQRFLAPRCAFTRHGAELQLIVPSRVLDGPYLAVYLQWHIPHAQQLTGALAAGDASATWLFVIRPMARVRASSP
jgi:hypothetical protein